MLMRDAAELEGAIDQLADHLQTGLRKLDSPTQLQLLEVSIGRVRPNQRPTLPTGESVLSLQTLVERGQKFPTIYADSPWPYENEASGVAAANYHRIMPIDDLCADPIDQFTHDNEPLYLWTTPAVLRESLGVSSDCSGPCEWFLVRLWRNPFP
jgi:hypothetical protein